MVLSRGRKAAWLGDRRRFGSQSGGRSTFSHYQSSENRHERMDGMATIIQHRTSSSSRTCRKATSLENVPHVHRVSYLSHGFFFSCGTTTIPSLICVWLALQECRKRPELQGRGLAIAGMIISTVILILAFVVVVTIVVLAIMENATR